MTTLMTITFIFIALFLAWKLVRGLFIVILLILVAAAIYTCGLKGSIPVPHKEIPVREGITL
jgi:4-hydroxybenzoate polyprenyltransferase